MNSLQGHDEIQVADSLSLTDRKCYRIPGKMALVVNKAKKAPAATIKSVIPAHIDSSEVLDLGSGLCRGPKWQLNNWPKDEGMNLVVNLNSRVRTPFKILFQVWHSKKFF